MGAQIIDLDRIVFELERPHKTAWKKIVHVFGKKILLANRTIDRKKLAQRVFSNPTELQKLNCITHPLALNKMKKTLKAKKNAFFCVVDIPLLFEVHEEHSFDIVVVVKTNAKTVAKRLAKNRHLSKKEIRARAKAQWPLPRKIAQADFVVDNNDGLARTKQQGQKIFQTLEKTRFQKG